MNDPTNVHILIAIGIGFILQAFVWWIFRKPELKEKNNMRELPDSVNIKEEITIEIATKELYNKAIERLKEEMLEEIAEEIYKKLTAKFNDNDTEEGFIGRTD